MLAVVVATAMAIGLTPSGRSIVSEMTKRREHFGQCFRTRVLRVETRLVGGDGKPVADSGSAIAFADGHYNVSYDILPGIQRSRRGDPVKLCVIRIPTGCPPHDTRGILYRSLNLRTHLSWKATDTEHMCGGA